MAPTHPQEIVLLDGRRFAVAAVHHQMSRTQWRVTWFDERPKGGLAEVDGDVWREVEKGARAVPA